MAKIKKFDGSKVVVQHDNVEKALRTFKKKILDNGLLDELREREQYDKPSTVKRKEKNQQVRRAKKKLESEQLTKGLY